LVTHTEDAGAHIRAVFEDSEYWRTKRLEPVMFQLIRKGKLTFFDLIQATSKTRLAPPLQNVSQQAALEDSVEALELNLGKYINGIEIAAQVARDSYFIDEQRKDAGIYDPELKFVHREFVEGTDLDRLSAVQKMLEEYYEVLQVYLNTLVSRGFIKEDKLKEMIEAPVPPKFENGAKIVALAWTDPAFKSKLLQDAKQAIRELGIAVYRSPKVVALENTEKVHNVIVCTLCSCYPYAILGNPPWWYKDDKYKQAIVANPRKTLKEMFDFAVPEDVEVKVYDSTSDVRYFVLPAMPPGKVAKENLWKLVTPESLIGVGEPRSELPS
jgi:nitrile hydratase